MSDHKQQDETYDMYDEENNWLYQEVVNLDEDDEDEEESEDENGDEANEATEVRVNGEHETDSDATEIDEDYAAISGE